MRSIRPSLASLLVAATLGTAPAAAQQPPAAPAQPVAERTAAQTPEQERAALRARMERRLAETKTLEDRLESALKRLDAGASTEEIRGAVESPGRHGRPGMGGPGRDSPQRPRRDSAG